MASKYEIQLDFDRAKKDIYNLDIAATDLNKLAVNKLNDTIKGISNSWKGFNATMFITKGNELEYKISKTAKELEKTVLEMRYVVHRIYYAELEAIETARKRDY